MEEGKLIAVKWYDACSRTLDGDVLKTFEHIHSGKEFLVINITYGKLLKVFDESVVIITEDSDTNDVEVTVIPRGWIIEPEEIKGGKL